MRVTTALLFDTGLANIQRSQAALFKIQNQISTGRRVLNPADDPVASAQALVTTQAQQVNLQLIENQETAKSTLGLLDGQLQSLTDLVQNIRERAVQLGNATLSPKERSFIAEELRERFDELVGIGNVRDGQGRFLFSGFQGAVKPFSLTPLPGSAPFSAGTNAIPPAVGITPDPYVTYAGDQGERLLQVGPSRQMGVSVAGSELFMNIRQGNGTFAVAANAANTGTGIADQGDVLDVAKWNASTLQPQNFRIEFRKANGSFDVAAAAGNTGSGVMDQGTVTDAGKWNASLVQPQNFSVVFAVDNSGPVPVTKYNLVATGSGNSLVTNLPPGPATGADWRVYTPGAPIAFNGLDAAVAPGGDLGVSVVVTGTPAAGDSFAITPRAPGSVPALQYTLVDAVTGNSLLKPIPPGALPGALGSADWRTFTPGQAITFNGLDASVVAGGDLGVRVVIEGTPATGDSFAVSASQNQSIFDTVQNLIAAASANSAVASAGNTLRANRLGESLENLDQALDNIVRVRATVGSRLNELDSLREASADKELQYQDRLSTLQDLDYAAAITDLNKRQLELEAAQRSFVRINSLSLFDLL